MPVCRSLLSKYVSHPPGMKLPDTDSASQSEHSGRQLPNTDPTQAETNSSESQITPHKIRKVAHFI